MSRPNCRRSLRLESLESRELLSSGGPTDQQQYMLYLLNQSRQNPAQMAQTVTSNLDANVSATIAYYNVDLNQVKQEIASAPAKPPLAWNDQLATAAQGQSQYQADNGVQSHTGANGSSLEQRLDQAGYTNRTTDGENAYAYSSSVDQAMEAFLIDWGVASHGHRDNILQPNTSTGDAYRDVGIGIVNATKSQVGPMVITQDFGAQQGEKAELVGVAFSDPNHSGTYNLGEGVGNVTIQVTNKSTGATTSVQTWDAGGYQMALDPGSYTVTAISGGKVVRSQDVQIGTSNVEVDFNLSNAWQGTPAPSTTTPPATTAAAISTPTP
ncbi:CAP domain-containing protein, partial [Singulisphaera rosea]